MNRHPIRCLLLLTVLGVAGRAEEVVDFDGQVRPILSDNCFACHGPDAESREAGLRLDVREQAFGETESGTTPIVAGDPEASELVARIESDDEYVRMPPPDSGKTLKPEQIALLRRWVKQGASWREHWSLVPPREPAPPAVRDDGWPRGEIDRFVLARLEAEGLSPSPEADKATLIRRVTFDLTGLPPTLAEIDDYLADDSPRDYEKLVDRLLGSPRYGEHMARFWLDAARYGDTHGLHLDNYREMWPYRDWVVRAFNRNMPFDRFAIEQLAGDLLPDPTDDQRVATGFNRCHVTTGEGGSITEEVYVRNVVDRVVTTGTVFMGMTLDCTRCHDHKFDPLTMKDFYSMFAFFNSLDGDPLDGNKQDPAPVLKVPTEAQRERIAELDRNIERLERQVRVELARHPYRPPDGDASPRPPRRREIVWIDDGVPEGATTADGWRFVGPPHPVHGGEKSTTRTAAGLSQHYFNGVPDALEVGEGDRLFAHVYLDPSDPPKQIMLQWNDGSWEHRAYWGENNIDWGRDDTPSRRRMGELPAAGEWVRLEVAAADVGLPPGARINGWAFTQFDGTTYWDTAGIVSLERPTHFDSLSAWEAHQRGLDKTSLPKDIEAIIRRDAGGHDEKDRERLVDYFVEHSYTETRDVFGPLHERIEQARKERKQQQDAAPTTLVFRETESPRPAFVLNRGEYDQRRDPVKRATPVALPPLDEDAPRNRLGLARWLVDPRHPLTARVTVNRFWQQAFGTGIVKTAEDFGSQGEPPSHPRLLDWLALRLIEDGWDVKRSMKRIVMSATYRQSSAVTPSLLERDPGNRLLARGPRYRLDAEMLRDQALSAGGLLVDRLGGPSVKPPQPDGLWFAVGYSGSNTVRFKADVGHEKIHRRTLYTFIKRTSPPPQMSTLDAPSRESCQVRRERTNTPLQALMMLNDPQYFEAARALARRAMRQGGDVSRKAGFIYRTCSGREPAESVLEELVACHRDVLAEFADDRESAARVISGGGELPDANAATGDRPDTRQWAAWTMVANLVLNLDEVICKN